MRELVLRLLVVLLVAATWLYHLLLWSPVKAVATFLAKKLETLELQLLVAGADRRTRQERKQK